MADVLESSRKNSELPIVLDSLASYKPPSRFKELVSFFPEFPINEERIMEE